MLTRREQGLAAAAVAVLLAGIAGSGSVGHPVVTVAPAAEARISLPAPTSLPVPKPTAARRARVAKPRPLVRTPVAPAPPLAGCPIPKRPPSTYHPVPLGPPAVADAALPAPLPARAKASSLSAVRGKGLWVTPWVKTDVDVRSLVAQAKRAGVHSLWIRTGGTRQGYYGNHFLPQLVPAAHAAGLVVVAWDFPFLSDPVADARRAQQALDGGVDAFSPDVETAAEGTYTTPRRLAVYLSLVRAYAGGRPVVATVPRPTRQKSAFPYQAFLPYADVFAPMVYWSCLEPGALVTASIKRLGALLPVAPIGQAYDMGGEGGRVGTPSRLETLRFLDAARRGGAIGASLWTVEQAGPGQLQALRDYSWASASHR